MITDTVERQTVTRKTETLPTHKGWVLIKIDTDESQSAVVPHALAVASGLGRRVRLIEAMDTGNGSEALIDPVDWDRRKREVQLHLEHVVDQYNQEHSAIDIEVLEKAFPGDIKTCNGDLSPILAFARHGSVLSSLMDKANRTLFENRRSSILMVPDQCSTQAVVAYKRILVPLDGSCRAEAALPVAIGLAENHGAELYLVHITPEPSFTHNGPMSAEDLELKRKLSDRNERVALDYMKNIKAVCNGSSYCVKTKVLSKGDVRRLLLEIAVDLETDLVVLNSHGAGGHDDVLSGSVASFILEHSTLPVLMIGQGSHASDSQLYSKICNPCLRQPSLATNAS